MTAVPRRTQWQPRARASPRWRTIGPTVAASRHTTPQSTTLGLHPVIHVWLHDYSWLHGSLLIYWPLRDGWLSWPCWLTDSGQLNSKVVTHPANSLEQDRASSPAETSVLTTMLRRQPMRGTWSTCRDFRSWELRSYSRTALICVLRSKSRCHFFRQKIMFHCRVQNIQYAIQAVTLTPLQWSTWCLQCSDSVSAVTELKNNHRSEDPA